MVKCGVFMVVGGNRVLCNAEMRQGNILTLARLISFVRDMFGDMSWTLVFVVWRKLGDIRNYFVRSFS